MGFDSAFSRFGTMFFADPVGALSNVRRSLRPGGKLGFVCWRRLEENQLDCFPLYAALPYLPTALVERASLAPHFAFSDAGYIGATLAAAGYEGVSIRAIDRAVECGGLPQTADVCSSFGSLGKILREHPALAMCAVPALEQALRREASQGAVSLNAAVWIVTAINPG